MGVAALLSGNTLPSSLPQVVLVFIICLVLYVVLVSIYRLTLHPLARYPGPLLSKITSLNLYHQSTTGDRHLNQLAEHIKYGPVVRIAPNSLSVSSPSALKHIYQSSKANNPLRKSAWYETIDAPSGAYSTHTEIDRSKHAWRRRVVDHAFSDASLRSAETFIIENTSIFCRVLAPSPPNQWSKPQNMSDLCTYFAYDVMGDLVFGKRFDCLTSPEHRFVPHLLMSSTAFIYPIAYFPMQWLIRPLISSPFLMNLLGGQMARDEHAYIAYANDRVTERLALEDPTSTTTTTSTTDLEKSTEAGLTNAKSRKDMMHYMMHARDPITSQPFTRSDLDAESSLLIAAGADTTSTVLAACFHYLTLPTSTSTSILTTLQTQLRETYPTLSTITSPTITTHPLLRACIDETMRLSPPVPTHLARTTLQPVTIPLNDDGTDSILVPKGVTLGSPAYVLHHDPLLFENSFSFDPLRWLPSQTPAAQLTGMREAFAPFSLGSRGCVGKNLAYLEMCVILARTLWCYDIRRSDSVVGGGVGGVSNKGGEKTTLRTKVEFEEAGFVKAGLKWHEDEYQLKDRFLAEREGPVVEVRVWKGASKEVEELMKESEKREGLMKEAE